MQSDSDSHPATYEGLRYACLRRIPIKCSFCGRGQDEVARLVSGPTVYICSECVKLCNDILEGEAEHEISRERGRTSPSRRRSSAFSTST